MTCFDAHSDIWTDVTARRLKGETDVLRKHHLDRLRKGGVEGSIFVIWVDPPYERDYPARTRQIMDCVTAEIAACDGIRVVRTYDEMLRAKADGKFYVFIGVEGMAAVGTDLGKIDGYYDLGARHGMLTWNEENALGAGANSGVTTGLTDLGKAAVRKMREKRMLLDVSHLNEAGFWDLVKLADAPIIASHSNCKALCDVPRNLTDDQLRAIRDLNGVVGLNAYKGFVDPDPANWTVEGLAQRENVNAAFFLLALQRGLSAAILNPNSRAMMNAYRAYCALAALDPNCAAYIAHCAGASAEPAASPSAQGLDLGDAVLRGLKDSAVAAATAALEHRAPMELINETLIPALDVVGREFEAGRLYLPQLLVSAEAAKAVFELLRETMRSTGTAPARLKGTVILATVKGDVHDIGKNIVKVLMENYGYRVIDLGKNVEPELVAETAVREAADLVGLSALMTTTVGSMAETIRLLRARRPECRIMVGGAVLTEDYARQIGADFYGKDAMSDIRFAEGEAASLL